MNNSATFALLNWILVTAHGRIFAIQKFNLCCATSLQAEILDETERERERERERPTDVLSELHSSCVLHGNKTEEEKCKFVSLRNAKLTTLKKGEQELLYKFHKKPILDPKSRCETTSR
jgi:hypothetical protein